MLEEREGSWPDGILNKMVMYGNGRGGNDAAGDEFGVVE